MPVHVCLLTRLCLILCDPHGLYPARLLCPWNSPGKNTGVSCHSLLQGIFKIEPGSPELQVGSLPSEPPGKPHYTYNDGIQNSNIVRYYCLEVKLLDITLGHKNKDRCGI